MHDHYCCSQCCSQCCSTLLADQAQTCIAACCSHFEAHAAYVQNAQQVLVSALRREDMATKQVQHLQSELAALQDLLMANQRELQRNQMVMKFRSAEVERRRVCFTAKCCQSIPQTFTRLMLFSPSILKCCEPCAVMPTAVSHTSNTADSAVLYGLKYVCLWLCTCTAHA